MLDDSTFIQLIQFSDRARCPLPGGREGHCVEPERCALPVHLRYFGYYWRSRGVRSFCKLSYSRRTPYLVCCLRLKYEDDNGRDNRGRPPWRVPTTDNVLWNGTEWIEDRHGNEESSENIVTMDAIYQTSKCRSFHILNQFLFKFKFISECEEYTRVARDAVPPTQSPVFRTFIVGGVKTAPQEFPHMVKLDLLFLCYIDYIGQHYFRLY